jgi:hypothetical protein
MDIESIEEKIVKILDKPMKNIEIYDTFKKKISKKDIAKAIRNLRLKGKIVSRFDTSKREHMRLSTAIETLFGEFGKLKYEVKLLKKS